MIEEDKIYETNVENLRLAEEECIARGKEHMRVCVRLLFLAVPEVSGALIIRLIEDKF